MLQNVKVTPLRSDETRPPEHGNSPNRYSLSKLLALDAYCSTTSWRRALAVLVCTPVPSLVSSLVPSLISLENPARGIKHNQSALVHYFLLSTCASFGTILLTLGATAAPRSLYPETKAFAIAVVSGVQLTLIIRLLGSIWMFPLPFAAVTLGPVWGACLVSSNCLILYQTFKSHPELARSLARYAIPLCIQVSLFAIYSALTVAFDSVPTIYQIAMVLCFPLVKFVLKLVMHRFTRQFGEMGSEVAISTVEIFTSLYQSMIMQTTPSTLAVCAIMGLDAVQGFIAIKFLTGRQSTTPRRELFKRAMEALQCPEGPLETAKREWEVVENALELASAIDSILLIEYFEVSVPIVNALFLLCSYRSTSTLYNTRMNRFFDNTTLVVSSTVSVLLYSLLQGLSFVIFHWVLRRRFEISAFHHLAFVLEYHARSIQGKLIVFVPLISYFTELHYGADFSLKFDITAQLASLNLPTA